ncbi:MAG: hypothetical protein M0T83_06185 [Nitrospiraceae bacterium]|nr:hypothetical protein [Nitrospiraceae bacterium]
MKKVGLVLLVFLIILAGGLFWLHNNMDTLVKDAIEKYGSEMTGTKVEVSSVKIRAAKGQGVVRGLMVGNPSGFKTPYALKVGRIEMDLDVSSILKPVVLIRKIAVASPDVIYERANGTTNFDVLQKNIEEKVGSSKASTGQEKGGKKLIVDQLSIRGAKAQASAGFMKGKTVRVGLPDITLRNIGKAEGGVPPGKLGQEVGQALKEKLEAAVNFDALARSMGQTLQKAGSELGGKAKNAIKGLFGQ